MRISVVTPSFNQGTFIETAIRSVLSQTGADIEYLVLDGGSTDGTLDVLQKYAVDFDYWRSQPDGGQAAALREGFARATGEIFCWLNSDDVLLPSCLETVSAYFSTHPDVDCAVGGALVINSENRVVADRFGLPRAVRGRKETLRTLLARRGCSFYQPASFWRRQAYERCGGVDASLTFAMDYDLYLRLAAQKPFGHIDRYLACFRIHADSKSTKLAATRRRETEDLVHRYSAGRRRMFDGAVPKGLLLLDSFLANLPHRIRIKWGHPKVTSSIP